MAAVVGARGGFRQADPPFSAGLVAPSVLEWLQVPLLVALAGVVGIVIAHLPRGRALALLVVGVVTAMGTLIIWAFGAMPLRAMHPLFLRTTSEPLPADFTLQDWDGKTSLLEADEYDWWRMVRSDDATLAWHLVGVVGVALVLVALAIRLADRDDRRPAPLAAIGAVVTLASIGAPARGHRPDVTLLLASSTGRWATARTTRWAPVVVAPVLVTVGDGAGRAQRADGGRCHHGDGAAAGRGHGGLRR